MVRLHKVKIYKEEEEEIVLGFNKLCVFVQVSRVSVLVKRLNFGDHLTSFP
jgi:hypothetical protein